MIKLVSEYTDIKDIRHSVEHLTMTDTDDTGKESIIEALYLALTRTGKPVPA